MKLYKTIKTGERVEANVILVSGGYTVQSFRLNGDAGGWQLMTRTYKTLAGLLRAAANRGIYVDAKSCGI